MDEDDNAVHTPQNPYCGDPTCWCHNDADYHEGLTHGTFAHPHLSDVPPTEEEIETAYMFFGLPLKRGGDK
jgi:hypothetical protein